MNDTKQSMYKSLCGKIYGGYIDVESTENTIENYTKLAEEYENDFVGLGYHTPMAIAETALKLIKDAEDIQILDIACGTGLVADGLRKSGFKGAIDGVDGSPGMLKLAEAKGLYRHLKEQFITSSQPIMFDDNVYSAVVCCGGFGPGHLMPNVLDDLIRVTKPSGIIVFATRDNKAADDYVNGLNVEVDRLIQVGKWKKENVFQTPYFDYDASADNASNSLLASIYCCRKL